MKKPLIYESPEAFATRNNDGSAPLHRCVEAYYNALVDAGAYIGGDPLTVPDTETTVRINEAKRRVQDGPYADTQDRLGGLIILELQVIARGILAPGVLWRNQRWVDPISTPAGAGTSGRAVKG